MVELLIVFVIVWSSCGIAVLWYILRWTTTYIADLTQRSHDALDRNTEATNSLMSELRAIKRYVHTKHGRSGRGNQNNS